MTATEDPRLARAQELLAPYGKTMTPSQLADFLEEKTTGPVHRRIRRGEFETIDLGNGRHRIPTDGLAVWLADRLTTTTQEDQ